MIVAVRIVPRFQPSLPFIASMLPGTSSLHIQVRLAPSDPAHLTRDSRRIAPARARSAFAVDQFATSSGAVRRSSRSVASVIATPRP